MNKFAFKKSFASGCFLIFLLLAIQSKAQIKQENSETESCQKQADSADLSQYAGKFEMNDGSVLFVEETDGELTIRPIFFRLITALHRLDGDTFGIEEHADRQIIFIRDTSGCVEAVKFQGFSDADGIFPRVGDKKIPVELLLAGKPQEAAEQMVKAAPNGFEKQLKTAQAFVYRFPSRSADAVKFLQTLAKYYPKNSAIYSTLGDAYISAGNRKPAKANYLRAFKLDGANKTALAGLRKLKAPPSTVSAKTDGWKIPFSLDYLFAKPTAAEIKEVEAEWSERDLSLKDIAEVAKGRLNLGYTEATVQIISHSVHGRKHYGAIIVPDGINAKAPVILDLKGVSPDYFPLDLTRIHSPKFLGREQKQFIYFVPSFRGEVLNFDGKEYVSEGDRTDVWDGATDDALAFLNAALSLTPQADMTRVCAFGKSRGGSLALLAGIRDSKINRVLDWAGPTDWFELMGTQGWTNKEIVAEALYSRAMPEEDGGQFIETFLVKAMERKRTLREVRLQMLASSPLYFANRLPRLQIHYGIEDEVVPVRNGQAIAQWLKNQRQDSSTFEAFFYENSGHDLDKRLAYAQSKKFLLQLLSSGK